MPSRSGAPRHPVWYGNLLANPRTIVEVGAERVPVVARLAEGAERERIWAKEVALIPKFAESRGRPDVAKATFATLKVAKVAFATCPRRGCRFPNGSFRVTGRTTRVIRRTTRVTGWTTRAWGATSRSRHTTIRGGRGQADPGRRAGTGSRDLTNRPAESDAYLDGLGWAGGMNRVNNGGIAFSLPSGSNSSSTSR
ncbi:nitroreductase/quinone reductase family protein [Amycolatopsis sp. cmx-4-54]|uniref:nitroreductase/quinone reductase family protein n=1 Tax=Amycolatopsis sp. cmx-4-54 TaxID=2790936 RepID=UPI00397E797C